MTSVIEDRAADAARSDRAFLGHPIGLAYLAFAEAWERFSYYGMLGMLTLYLTTRLLLPGHVENVAGMAGLRDLLESIRGPLSVMAFATQISGLYGGLVYLTPIIGGLVADRALGRKMTVTIGVATMAFGHFLMAFPAGLALYARLSPPALAATMMGVFYLQFFIASNLAGFLGGYLEKMPGSQFWGMHAAMTGFAGMIVLVVRRSFGHMAESHAAG